MKIGLVIYGALETVSGGYLYDRKLVEFLRASGDTVDIISIPWRNYAAHLSDNFTSEWFHRLRSFEGDLLLQDELNHPSLFYLNRKLNPFQPSPRIAIVHHLRASERHPRWLQPLYRGVERAYLQTVRGFVFNSQTTKRAVESLLGVPDASGVVAYPAGDRFSVRITEKYISDRANQPGPLRLLFVGNVIPRKGLHVLFEALSRLEQGTWELDVIGDLGADKRYARVLQRATRESRWEAQVRFHGALDDASLANLAMRSHVLVMPSSYEGFGIAYLEGMGFGLPAIGTMSGAAWELITDGENGFLVDREDARSLAQHLNRLFLHRDDLVRMSLAARKKFLSHPTWETSMARIREYLACL